MSNNKHNIYMVQVSDSYGERIKSAYIPYAAGVLISSAMSNEEIRGSYEFKDFVFIREEPDAVVARMEEPFIVGFSNYIWNTEYNKTLAKKIKSSFPGCHIVFGGHNVDPGAVFLENYDFIDFLIFGEGEAPFRRLLLALDSAEKDFSEIPSLAYRAGDKSIKVNPVGAVEELTAPSPYLEGYFDRMVQEHPEIRFSAILETSRGCPYKCAYCDWGALKSKVRKYPTQQAIDEIQWFSEHKIEYVWGADANFGLFERDREIVECLVRAKQKTGYPQKIRVNYAKSNYDNVFEISKLLSRNGASKYGATLSFQSMSDNVLKIIGRDNIKTGDFGELLARYNSLSMRTYSELILGLPGETYDSFCKGIGELLRAGQHDGIECYQCVLLPNSEMGSKDFVEKYKIKVVTCANVQAHVPQGTSITEEYSRTIVGTSTMDTESWIRANQFIAMVQALHCNGLLRFFAMYLCAERNLKYEDFYNSFLSFFSAKEKENGLAARVLGAIGEHNRIIARDKVIEGLVVPQIGSINWLPDEYVFLNYIYDAEAFYREADEFLRTFDIEPEIYADLFKYQKEMMRSPFVGDKDIELSYDWYTYFSLLRKNGSAELSKISNTVIISSQETYADWQDYARRVVWYERFGGSSMYSSITVKYNN